MQFDCTNPNDTEGTMDLIASGAPISPLIKSPPIITFS
jgi:hypothetical protein